MVFSKNTAIGIPIMAFYIGHFKKKGPIAAFGNATISLAQIFFFKKMLKAYSPSLKKKNLIKDL